MSKTEIDRAVAAERSRLAAVAAAPAFRGRELAAVAMLTNTTMSAEAIVAALSGVSGPTSEREMGAAIAAGLPAAMRAK